MRALENVKPNFIDIPHDYWTLGYISLLNTIVNSTLDIPIMTQTVYGPNPEYAAIDGFNNPFITLFTKYFKIQ